MTSQKVRITLSWGYIIAFLALTVLMGTSHEFVHHFAGAAICGEFGFKTFNSFVLPAGCEENPWSLLATLAGPLFTFGIMWWGASLLGRKDPAQRQLGFALIFANFPINRLLFVLLYSNDEHWLANQLFGSSQSVHWLTVLAVWAVAVPPIVWGYLAIENSRRPLWFLAFFVLPFMFVVLFAGLFLENYLLLGAGVLDEKVSGIPVLIIIVELVCFGLWLGFRRRLLRSGKAEEGDLSERPHR